MQSIKLTDKFGLDIDAQPAPRSALLKYFQQLPSLRFDTLDLSKIGGLTLEEPAIQSLTTGISFTDPVNLGDGAPAFSVGAGAHASIEIIDDADALPGRDDTMKPLDGACYVAFGIDATASSNLGVTSGKLQFGAAPSTEMKAVSYCRFPLKTGVTLLQAIERTVAAFSMPACASDLADLPVGQIAKVEVRGKLKLSGSVDLFATANPLASASLPAPLPAVSVSAGGSATVGLSCAIEAEYQIVARKLDNGAVRLSWSHKNATEVAVTAKVSEGISAAFGSTDLFSKIVGAISADAQADLKELAGAGVPDSQAGDIQSAVQAATSRTLEIAVAGELTASDSHGAAFLYEINPAALTEESRTAIDEALAGDLSGLHAANLPGVLCVNSIWDHVRKMGLELKVNLLGILNYRSVSTLSLEGKVLYEPATGSMVITDKATAERIQSTQINFGADTAKLRHVLAESFLITAAYHGAKQLAGVAALNCSHSFFELENTTSRIDMAHKLRTGLALGLLSSSETALPEGVTDFGRTLFSASTEYREDLVNGMFLDSNENALPREWYERAGRAAIQFLVQDGDEDAVRRQPVIDDGLWSRMKDVGQPGFAAFFPGVRAALVGAIVADYSVIQWWADAMSDTSQRLAAFRLWQARNSTATFDDPAFQSQREALAKYLRQVAGATREEFGQPWGLIAMNQLASRGAGTKVVLTGPRLALNRRRALVAVA